MRIEIKDYEVVDNGRPNKVISSSGALMALIAYLLTPLSSPNLNLRSIGQKIHIATITKGLTCMRKQRS